MSSYYRVFLKKIAFIILLIIFGYSSGLANDLSSTQKQELKEKLFIPIVNLYKKIIVDKQIQGLIGQISISLSVGNKIPIGQEITSIKNYIFSFIPQDKAQIANNIREKSDYIRSWIIAGISAREYGWARINNPKNGYGNFQITSSNVCGNIIIPNNINLGLGKKIYFTPPSLCEGVYKLCTYDNKENYTCTCNNINYRTQKAKLLDGKNGFNADQWIEMYRNFCIGKPSDTNVFNNLWYPFQYADFIGFVYNKINGYQNGVYIVYNMKNGINYRGKVIMSLGTLIDKAYKKNLKPEIDSILDGYISYLKSHNKVLADLSDGKVDFPVEINGKQTTYQQELIKLGKELGTTPDVIANLFNSYQLAIIYSKYNGLGNVGKNFLDNSYVSNITKKGAQNIGLNIYYIFGKITKDYCITCIAKDLQPYGAMIYANIYNKKENFLQYILLQLYPIMIQNNMFSKLISYMLY